MKRKIYVMCDQVSGQYGGVFDFANDADCVRAFKNMSSSGQIPEHVVRDTVIIQLAEVDFSGASPVVNCVMPTIVYYGSEVFASES